MLENWQVLMSPPGSAHLALGASVNAEKYEKFCSHPLPSFVGGARVQDRGSGTGEVQAR